MNDTTQSSAGESHTGENFQGNGQASDKGQLVAQGKSFVIAQIAQRQHKAAEDLTKLAQTLRKAGEVVGSDVGTPFVSKAADQVEKLATFVRDADVASLRTTVTQFAKKEPLLAITGGLTLGLLIVRVLRGMAAASAVKALKPS